MKALGIVGYSGSGKTTLGERLIAILVARGLRIAAVKHAHHGFEPDVRGKDSDRLRRAGAVQTLVFSAERWALYTEQQPPRPPTISALLSVLDDRLCDLVLIEGLRSADYPKLEVHRPSHGQPLLAATDRRVIAVATDAPAELRTLGLHCPVLDLNDLRAVADFVGSFAKGGTPQMSDTASTPPSDGASQQKFEDLRKKFEERIGQLGQQIDELSERFTKGAHEAKAGVEADLAKLKQEHQAEYEQFQKLQKTAEESWGLLQKRLDGIAGDMRSALGQAVDQAASALGISTPASTKSAPQTPTATPAEASSADPAPSDAVTSDPK